MINFFLYCIIKWVFQAHRREPPTTGVVELWKKYFAMETGGVPQKNDVFFFFTGDLYSMYVVLQGMGSLPCIRVYIIYVIAFGEWQPWMSEVLKLQRCNQKKKVPRNDQFLFILYEKMSFSSSPKGTPHDWCRRTMKKIFCNENQWNSVVAFKKLITDGYPPRPVS